jgi:MSHA biogenesis protein MshL
VRLEPAPAGAVSRDSALPVMTPGQIVVRQASAQRLWITAVNSDVRQVLRELATRAGLGYQLDPSLTGTVNANLRGATVNEALATVVPAGYTYQIQGGVLRVGPARVETRIYSLDYVAISRFGTATTLIQRRLTNNQNSAIGGAPSQTAATGAAGFGANASFGGADVITGVSIADIWEELRVGLEGLLFEPARAGETEEASAVNRGGAMLGQGTRASSRAAPDGTRLTINPIAGTITVSALPEKLDIAAMFIRTFETSIQRQVLIEAKIVEVNLEKTFQYGIDWSVVGRAGSGTIKVRTNPAADTGAGNIQFTLNGGAGSMTAVLNALSTQGEVKVLSNPRVSALNNQRAVFDVTTSEIVFSVNRQPILGANGGVIGFQTQVNPQQINVGIVLDVLPQIGADNTVTMNIRPVVTSVSSRRTLQLEDGTRFEAPVIDTRESDTMARLRAGETIIIGGLMQTRQEKLRSGIPGLRSIPLLGKLFTSYNDVERKGELVIFLTPTIIAGQPPASPQ